MMVLRMLGRVLLWVIGILPYLGLTILTVKLGDGILSFCPPEKLGVYELVRMVLSRENVLQTFAILGSWTSWYLFCKLVRYGSPWQNSS